MKPKWLADSNGCFATVVEYWPGQNKENALLIELDNVLKFDGFEGKYLILELRYAGDRWLEKNTVHLELLADIPERKKWQDRKQGIWIESHATYIKISNLTNKLARQFLAALKSAVRRLNLTPPFLVLPPIATTCMIYLNLI